MNYSNAAVMHAQKLGKKLLKRRIGKKKKELLERKIGGKSKIGSDLKKKKQASKHI